mgnify:CR=1 FL=1
MQRIQLVTAPDAPNPPGPFSHAAVVGDWVHTSGMGGLDPKTGQVVSDDVIEQITKHLNRLVEVVKVFDLSEGPHIERELMMIKVRAVGKEREELKRTTDIFRGRIIDVTDKSYTIELTGDGAKLDAFIDSIDRASILETVRSGGSGIGRGERILKV